MLRPSTNFPPTCAAAVPDGLGCRGFWAATYAPYSTTDAVIANQVRATDISCLLGRLVVVVVRASCPTWARTSAGILSARQTAEDVHSTDVFKRSQCAGFFLRCP